MRYIRLQWLPPAVNSAGLVGGEDFFVATEVEFHTSWFAFVPHAEAGLLDTWVTIPWEHIQHVTTSSDPLAPPA